MFSLEFEGPVMKTGKNRDWTVTVTDCDHNRGHGYR